VGVYTFRAEAIKNKDTSTKITSSNGTFTTTTSSHKGYIKVDQSRPLYFMHEDGTPFYAIGTNLSWPEDGPQKYPAYTVYDL